MIDCYILDDDRDAILLLKGYIDQTPGLNLVFSSQLPQEVLPYLKKPARPVIAFLDIDMPLLNGLQLAEMVSDETAVIFVTGHPEFAVEAFEKNARDYLLKPVPYERFFKAYLKVSKQLMHIDTPLSEEAKRYVFVPYKNGTQRKILLEDIIYTQMIENYARIFTTTESMMLRITLRELLFQLPSTRFLQVQKSYMVNIHKIRQLSASHILMDDGSKIPIGETYRTNLVLAIGEKTIRSHKG